MAHKHEVKRLEADLKLDESLKTEAGRSRRCQEPGDQAAKDSLFVDMDGCHKECLPQLYPLRVPGGIMVFDDHGAPTWPGAKRAVDEFFAGTRQKV